MSKNTTFLQHALVAGVSVVVAVGLTVGILFAALPICYEGDMPTADPMRPDYHYTPRFGWVNDPNGLVYYKGEWHLFYQHDFETTLHGNMSWGHAVSTDLVHWKELPLALKYSMDEQIFSGSVVVDTECVSGLCEPADHPVLIAFYTSYQQQGDHIQSQHIASSTDLGRTWQKYSGNPVLDQNNPEFRDPKVQRFGDGWLMLVQKSNEHILEFYQSKDLKTWGARVGSFGPAGEQGGVWECPDMFQLPVDGDPKKMKWVLLVNINPGARVIGSATQFWIGEFDGTNFTPDDTTRNSEWLDWGMDNYATITWDNVPDGQRISIGWMSNWNYTQIAPASTQFRNTFTSPRELKLKTIDGKVRLTQLPVQQLTSLRVSPPVAWGDNVTLSDGSKVLIDGAALDMEAVFTYTSAKEFGLRVLAGDGQETLVGYDTEKEEVFIDRTISGTVTFHEKFPGRHSVKYPLPSGGPLTVRVLVDRGSVEAFFGEGEVAITDVVFPDYSKMRADLYAKGGSATADSYSVWRMRSIHGVD